MLYFVIYENLGRVKGAVVEANDRFTVRTIVEDGEAPFCNVRKFRIFAIGEAVSKLTPDNPIEQVTDIVYLNFYN